MNIEDIANLTEIEALKKRGSYKKIQKLKLNYGTNRTKTRSNSERISLSP